MTPTLTLIKIVEEVELSEQAEAWLDEQAGLTIVQDISLPEDQQVYVHLNAQQVAALKQLLRNVL